MTEIWIIEMLDKLPSEISMVIATCSSRDKAIEWIKKYGELVLDPLSDRYSVFRTFLDNGMDSLPLEVNEYFTPKGEKIV
jgi:hypothetical protein